MAMPRQKSVTADSPRRTSRSLRQILRLMSLCAGMLARMPSAAPGREQAMSNRIDGEYRPRLHWIKIVSSALSAKKALCMDSMFSFDHVRSVA